MKINAIAINSFAKWLVGGVPFESAKRIVAGLNDRDMTGEMKRGLALEELKALGYSLAGFLMNLAIELAVAYMKEIGKK